MTNGNDKGPNNEEFDNKLSDADIYAKLMQLCTNLASLAKNISVAPCCE